MWYLTVKLNHDITRDLLIELIREIVSYTYKFKHQLKIQPVLRDIDDGTMCVLQTLTFPMFWSDIYSLEHAHWRLDTWLNRMHPKYDESRQYEGASQYFAKQDLIITSSKLKKQHKQCKYETRSKIAACVERYFIRKGR